MLNALYRTAEALGVEVALRGRGRRSRDRGRLVHLAPSCRTTAGTIRFRRARWSPRLGGFEANIEWLKQSWGAAADNFLIRGTPYNRGTVLKHAPRARRRADRRSDAVPRGRDRRARAEVRRRHHHPARLRGLRHRREQARAERFYDEGEDFWPKRYAIWGRLVAASPTRSPTSSSTRARSTSSCPRSIRPIAADSMAGARRQTRARSAGARGDGRRLQRAVRPGTSIPPSLDDCRTEGLDAAQDPLGAAASRSRRSTPIRCGPASPSPISARG